MQLNRSKRSLLPFLGDFMGTLFGTATKSDMRKVKTALTKLQGAQKQLDHIVANSITLLNKPILWPVKIERL